MKIKIKIDGKEISCQAGQTIMVVARMNGIEIPGFCGHPDFPPKGDCRVCVVEIKGRKKLDTSCTVIARDGMEIKTNSPRVKKVRNLNIELIFAEHIEKCATCIWQVNCRLLRFARKYDIKITRFRDRKGNRRTYRFANAVEIDGTQCIDCRNCLDACNIMQKINCLELKGKGHDQEVVPVNNGNKIKNLKKEKKIDCIYCGQCAVHCPVGAAQEQSHWEQVEKVLQDEKKVVVAQFAPSIRVSIGEEFDMPYGKIVTEQVVSGLRELGFNYVFDVNFGADVTTVVEAMELIKRIGNDGVMPMFTSCCPAWVKYAEFYHPELIPNLTTARSPHMHSGGVIKTYWAEKMKINPKNIVVVSVMPCTAKKFESSREEMKIKSNFPVDIVITNREFAWMMKRKNIDFPKLKKSKADNPLGEYSGAAAIYGGSGGVMESALRTAHALICGIKKTGACSSKIDFKEARGLEGVKEARVSVGGSKLRIAVVNGIGNVDNIIDNLEKYDYIEVMACPGGCIGGGGQPIPTTQWIREQRVKALYKLDKSSKIRKAHENKSVIKAMEWLEKKGKKLEHQVLHTKYKKRS